jgi:hypothetical protein
MQHIFQTEVHCPMNHSGVFLYISSIHNLAQVTSFTRQHTVNSSRIRPRDFIGQKYWNMIIQSLTESSVLPTIKVHTCRWYHLQIKLSPVLRSRHFLLVLFLVLELCCFTAWCQHFRDLQGWSDKARKWRNYIGFRQPSKCQASTAPPASVERCTLDRRGIWLRRESKSTTNTSISAIRISLQWWNTALTWANVTSHTHQYSGQGVKMHGPNHQGSNRDWAPTQHQ